MVKWGYSDIHNLSNDYKSDGKTKHQSETMPCFLFLLSIILSGKTKTENDIFSKMLRNYCLSFTVLLQNILQADLDEQI